MIEHDLLEELAAQSVPPPPADLDRRVHERVNRLLVAAHFADLALRGVGVAFWHFASPVLHALVLTVTGRPWPQRPPPQKDR
jgi:hypothetical protein